MNLNVYIIKYFNVEKRDIKSKKFKEYLKKLSGLCQQCWHSKGIDCKLKHPKPKLCEAGCHNFMNKKEHSSRCVFCQHSTKYGCSLNLNIKKSVNCKKWSDNRGQGTSAHFMITLAEYMRMSCGTSFTDDKVNGWIRE